MKRACLLIALSCWPALGAAQAPPRPGDAAAGMVITGDREAPLVLHIVPWQDPKPVAPPAVPALPLLPTVVDRSRGILDLPEHRSLGRLAPAAR